MVGWFSFSISFRNYGCKRIPCTDPSARLRFATKLTPSGTAPGGNIESRGDGDLNGGLSHRPIRGGGLPVSGSVGSMNGSERLDCRFCGDRRMSLPLAERPEPVWLIAATTPATRLRPPLLQRLRRWAPSAGVLRCGLAAVAVCVSRRSRRRNRGSRSHTRRRARDIPRKPRTCRSTSAASCSPSSPSIQAIRRPEKSHIAFLR